MYNCIHYTYIHRLYSLRIYQSVNSHMVSIANPQHLQQFCCVAVVCCMVSAGQPHCNAVDKDSSAKVHCLSDESEPSTNGLEVYYVTICHYVILVRSQEDSPIKQIRVYIYVYTCVLYTHKYIMYN